MKHFLKAFELYLGHDVFELPHLDLTLPQSPLHCLNFLFPAVSHSWSHINMQGRKAVMSLWGSRVNI